MAKLSGWLLFAPGLPINAMAFHPALFDLGKMRVTYADRYCRKDGCDNVVGRVVMTFVYLTDDALYFCREYADRECRTGQSCA